MIKQIFPTDIESTYYIPYVPSTASSKKVGAKGKFVEIYEYLRGLLRECGLTESRRGLSRKSVDNTGALLLGSLRILEGILFNIFF